MLKGLNMKSPNMQNMLLLGGLAVLVYAFIQYSGRKGFEGNSSMGDGAVNLGQVGESKQILGGEGGGAAPLQAPSAINNANDLLPKGGGGGTNGVVMDNPLASNFLQYGKDIGINTVNSSLRNPNLQLRPEPRIPPAKMDCPFNQSTIGPNDSVNMEQGFQQAGMV